uniref:Ribonuclease H-like domain-containing protein n=1 Tax=Tanacetum cinerariifolium TaxID=118510 RepID=A0A699GSP6_TANCI|nr:ribonuclease H-like domain-containing protein [Tanacetum cinerariifolium]
MHDPRDPHITALKRILRYVRGTLDYGMQLHVTLSRSSAEAEYQGVANVVAETAWIRNLLRELHTLLFTATLVYYDNLSAVYMSANPVQHQRLWILSRKDPIRYHEIRDNECLVKEVSENVIISDSEATTWAYWRRWKEGHSTEEYYKIVGYPVGHPLHGKYKPNAQKKNMPRTVNMTQTVVNTGVAQEENSGSNGYAMATSARMDQLQNQLNQMMLMMQQN